MGLTNEPPHVNISHQYYHCNVGVNTSFGSNPYEGLSRVIRRKNSIIHLSC